MFKSSGSYLQNSFYITMFSLEDSRGSPENHCGIWEETFDSQPQATSLFWIQPHSYGLG